MTYVVPLKDPIVTTQETITPPPMRNWKVPAMKVSRAMAAAIERAKEGQPPTHALTGKAGQPWANEK